MKELRRVRLPTYHPASAHLNDGYVAISELFPYSRVISAEFALDPPARDAPQEIERESGGAGPNSAGVIGLTAAAAESRRYSLQADFRLLTARA
jgi:hypothetical protein